MGDDLASGNPAAVPLLIATVLFVALLGGLGLVMARINRGKLARPKRVWTVAQKAYFKRRAVYCGVGMVLGAGLLVIVTTHATVLGLVGAAVTLAWMVFGPRLLGARSRPED
jgi:hypothetical protein